MRKTGFILAIFLCLLSACGGKNSPSGSAGEGTTASGTGSGAGGDGSSTGTGGGSGGEVSEGPSLELLTPARQFLSPNETADVVVKFQAGSVPLSTVQIAQDGKVLDGYPRPFSAEELASGRVYFEKLPSAPDGNHGDEAVYTVRITDEGGKSAELMARFVTVLPLYTIGDGKGHQGLIDSEQGLVEVEPVYSSIYPSVCGNKPCYQACLWDPDQGIFCGLLDPEGKIAIPLIDKALEEGETLGQPWFEFEKTFYIFEARVPGYHLDNFLTPGDPFDQDPTNNLHGILDEKGKEVLPPSYQAIHWIGETKPGYLPPPGKVYPYLALKLPNGLGFDLYDLRTRAVIGTYSSLGSATEGLVLASIDTGNGYKYGYLDLKAGAQVRIPLIYDNGWEFKDGLARVEQGGKWGMIDTQGKTVIKLQYDQLSEFEYGVAAAKKDGQGRLIGPDGQELSALYDDVYVSENFEAEEPLFSFRVGQQFGCINKLGQEWVKLQQPGVQVQCSTGTKGYVLLESDKYGLMKPSAEGGEQKLPIQFKYIDLYYGMPSLIAVHSDTQVDLLAADTLLPVFQKVAYYGGLSEDRAPLRLEGGLLGFINGEGVWKIDPQFQGIGDYPWGFSNGLACVKKGSSFGYIDVNGNPWVIPEDGNQSFVFEYCSGFEENGIATVRKYSWKTWGYLRKDGTYLWKPAP